MLKSIAGLAFALMLVISGFRAYAADAPPLTKVTFQLGSIPGASWAPFYLAKSEGLYAKEGLDVDILPGRTSQDALTAVTTGSAMMAIVVPLTEIIDGDKGQHVVSVASFFGRNAYGLVIGADTGARTLKDLAGKRILITSAIYENLLKALIKKAGGDPDASTYILVPNPGSLLGTYVAKQADAMEIILPYAQSALGNQRPSIFIPFANSGDPEPGYSIIVKPETLATQKPMIAKFLRATFAALKLANDNSAKMLATAVATVPGLTAAEDQTAYDAFRTFECDPTQKGKLLGAFVPENWATAAQVFLQIGAIDKAVDPKTLYTNEFFEGPNAVSNLKCPV